jgi:hypothetical protein
VRRCGSSLASASSTGIALHLQRMLAHMYQEVMRLPLRPLRQALITNSQPPAPAPSAPAPNAPAAAPPTHAHPPSPAPALSPARAFSLTLHLHLLLPLRPWPYAWPGTSAQVRLSLRSPPTNHRRRHDRASKQVLYITSKSIMNSCKQHRRAAMR